jgi:putative cell wall-binding protein
LSKINRHPVRRTAAGVLAGALALSGAVATALPANAAPGFALERIAGEGRYETSAAIARAFVAANTGAVTNVIVASGESTNTPDALAASFLAGVRNAPVVLTQRSTTPGATREVLTALRAQGATTLTVVGGPAAVSEEQLAAFTAQGFTVTRIGGANRYETAANIATAGEAGGTNGAASNVGLLASGVSTIDALAGGPVAFKGRHPLFLTTRDGIPGAIVRSMQANGVTSVYILGGEAVVGPRVVAQLAAANISVVARLSGADRSATSAAIANAVIGGTFGFSAATFNVASGINGGVDALGGGALSGKQNRVLLVTNTATSAAPITAFASARAATLTAVGNIFGGTTVVSAALETAIETAGGSSGNFQTLTVTPNTAVTLPLADEAATATAATDNRTYTVTGLTDTTRYRVTLVNAASIGGTAAAPTFLSSAIEPATTPATFAVNTGADIADITAVGGSSAVIGTTGGSNTLNTATAFPVNGSLTFTIDGTAPGTVVPLVYVDGGQGGTATTGGANNRLETSATAAGQFAAVTETFGVGGATTYTARQLESGAFGTGTAAGVSAVDKATNSLTLFSGADARGATYDANDLFFVGGVSVGLDAFEAALSSGDTVTGTFTRDVAGVSRFELNDVNPSAPAATATVGAGANSRTVTVTATFADDVDQVVVQRATVTGATNGVGGTAGEFATLATVAATDTAAGTSGTQISYVDTPAALGTYQYRVAGINDGDQGAFGAASANATTAAPSADVTGPTVTDTRLVTDGGLGGLLDAGDSFTVRFNETIAAPAAGAVIRVQDNDTDVDSVADLVNGTNATFTLNAAAIPATPTSNPNAGAAAGTVLTVTVTAAPTVVTAGTVSGIDLDATIVNTAGVNDVAGNRVNLADTTDLVINTEANPA